jgi:hypothetical protein
MTTVLATGADKRYGQWLLNMIGSVRTNSPGTFDRLVAYDLGLSHLQRRLLDGVRGVEVRSVPPFVPHWRQGGTWKTWIWTHVDAAIIVWLDAGLSVLRPLDRAVEQIEQHGYFAVSQETPLSATTPSDYWGLYGLSPELGNCTAIAAGIFGFATKDGFFEEVVVPTYEDCVAGRSLGFSRGDVVRLNQGLYRDLSPTVRDCTHFRHDLTVLNLRFRAAVEDPVVNDLDEYAGFRSAQDHPRQIIWNHRRRGTLRYLMKVPYRAKARPLGLAYGGYVALRWWLHTHRWLLRPKTYTSKGVRIVRALRKAV